MVLGLAKVHLNYFNFFNFFNDTIFYFSIACPGNIFDLVSFDVVVPWKVEQSFSHKSVVVLEECCHQNTTKSLNVVMEW